MMLMRNKMKHMHIRIKEKAVQGRKKMASMERLELPTVRLEGGCSIRLSYMDTSVYYHF